MARWGCAFDFRDTAALQAAHDRILTDDAARAELVAEAREHVLRLDWRSCPRHRSTRRCGGSAGRAAPRWPGGRGL